MLDQREILLLINTLLTSAGGGGGGGTVADNSITDAKLRDSSALSVIGRFSNAVGDPGDIVAGTDGHILRRSGNTIGFGTITASNVTGLSNVATTGSASDLSSGTIPDARMPDLTGDVTTTEGAVATTIAAGVVTNSKLANIPGLRIKGNNTAISAAPIDLTVTEVKALLAYAAGDISGLATVATSGSASDLGSGTLSTSRLPALSGDVTTSAGSGITSIAADAVTFAKLQNISTDTLLGRDSALTGNAEEISLNATLEFTGSSAIQRAALSGDVTAPAGSNTTAIAVNAVTDTKLRDSLGLSVIGRSANSTGDPADIVAISDGDVFRRSGTTVGFGSIPQASVSSLVTDLSGKLPVAGTVIDNSIARFDGTTGNAIVGSKLLIDDNGNLLSSGYFELEEIANPFDPTINKIHVYAGDDNGVTFLKVQDSDSHVINLSRDTVFICKNTQGTTITKGAFVYMSGSDTGNSISEVKLARADSLATLPVLGIALETLPNNTFGKILTHGLITDIDTLALTAGSKIYLSDSTAGIATTVKPSAPSFPQLVGIVITSHASTGSILFKLGEVESTLLSDGDRGDINVTSSGMSFTIDPNVVTDGKLRQSSGLSVVGRSAGTTGNVADITGSTAGQVLMVNSGILAFSHLPAASFLADSIDLDRLQNVGTNVLLGRDTAGTGDIEQLTLDGTLSFTGTGAIQREALSGDVTASAGSNTTTIANDAVTNAKLANMASLTIKGNGTGGAADPQDLTAAQAKTLLGISTGDITGLVTIASTGSASDLAAGTIPDARMPDLTGEVTTVAGAVATTITAGAVTNTKLADVAANTLKGNNTGSPTSPSDLTATQATAMLDTFTSALKGLTPASGGGTSNFLRADGTFAAPPSGPGGSGTFGQATATFTINTDSVVINVTDSGVNSSSVIMLSVATSPGRDMDELERAPIIPGLGTITDGVGFSIIVASLDGDADGAYLINYTRN